MGFCVLRPAVEPARLVLGQRLARALRFSASAIGSQKHFLPSASQHQSCDTHIAGHQ